MNPYDDAATAREYLEFLNSKNGKTQQAILAAAIVKRLKEDPAQQILDAACGSGWLTNILSEKYSQVYGCDGSEPLVTVAKQNYPEIEFQIANLTSPLPYPSSSFETIILNMVLSDLDDIPAAFRNIHSYLKDQGRVIVTLPNPYYNYPTGVWRRGLLEKLAGKKAKLTLIQPYFGTDAHKSPTWGKLPTSYIRPLADYINSALAAGLSLRFFQDLQSPQDSQNFDLTYQLHRFPLLLLLEFKKV